MGLYCYQDSALGYATNLQLYSLRQAYRNWKYLHENKEHLSNGKIREICAFITATLGISLSQLLGQNLPGPHTIKGLPTPKKLFAKVMQSYVKDTNKYQNLETRFSELIDYYDASRHFGLDKDKKQHSKIDDITIDKADEFLNTALEVWDYIILTKKNEKNNELYEYNNIKELLDGLEEGDYQEDLVD